MIVSEMDERAIDGLRFVGDLQVYESPTVSLYLNEAEDKLILFFKTSQCASNNEKFIVASVSSDRLLSYMNRDLPLVSLFRKGTYRFASIVDGLICFETPKHSSPYNLLRKAGKFDPDFCYGRIRILSFLNKHKNL